MTPLTLLTTHDCHLCSHGRSVLAELASEGLLTWQEVDTDTEEGRVLAQTAPPLRPVLLAPDGHLVAYGRLSAKALRRRLQQSAATAPSAGRTWRGIYPGH